MTFFKDFKPTQQEQFKSDLAAHLGMLWERYAISSNPNDLADYIEKGGEVNASTRLIVADLLRLAPKGDKTDRYGALEAFSNINALLKAKDGPKTKTAAYELYAEGKSFSARGAKEKYSEGKKLAKKMGLLD